MEFTLHIVMKCIQLLKILFLLPCLVIGVSCENKKDQIQPVRQAISESVYASGVVLSKNQYQVYSTVNGIIKEILVKEGDLVKKGQPLLRIINKISLLQERNAELAAQYARLNANQEKLDDLRMAIDLAAKKVDNDYLLLQRQRRLWEQKIGTKVELEQRELAYNDAVNDHKSLQIKYNDLKKQLTLNARQAENNFAISSITVEDHVIKSEVNGKVYSILKEQGELVNVQSPVALVGDAENFYLELQVDEYDIARIIEGQRVFVSMDSYRNETFEAITTRISPVMNERSRSFTVEASFIKRPDRLYPYLTAEANILIRKKEDALTIPRSYLFDESYVLTTKNKKVKVVTGLKDYQKVEIISGITADDYLLKPGN
jgi:HlyD family secretion protein